MKILRVGLLLSLFYTWGVFIPAGLSLYTWAYFLNIMLEIPPQIKMFPLLLLLKCVPSPAPAPLENVKLQYWDIDLYIQYYLVELLLQCNDRININNFYEDRFLTVFLNVYYGKALQWNGILAKFSPHCIGN